MKENRLLENVKHTFQRKWNRFVYWFTEKEHPHSRLNKRRFFYDLLKLTGLILGFFIVNSNVYKLNQIVLVFIKIGSLLQLVLLFFILRKAWHLILNLKYAFRGLNHGIKAIIAIAIVLLLFFAFRNQDKVVNSVVDSYERIEFQTFNPVNTKINVSGFNLKSLSKSLSTCPQINVSIEGTLTDLMFQRLGYTGLTIRDKNYDGWTIIGDATCYKGHNEGENVNYYYCGGYRSQFGIGSVDAYTQKTIISESGDIGKTYKYVIWNVYDENRNFIETKCVGDPDDFKKKQIEAIDKELQKWK